MDIFSRIEDFISENIYAKIITTSDKTLTTSGTTIKEFSVPAGYTALIHEIDADNSINAEIDFLVEDQTLGEKYGLPIRTKAIKSGGIKANIKVESGKKVTIQGRGIGSDVTISYVRITVLFIKR